MLDLMLTATGRSDKVASTELQLASLGLLAGASSLRLPAGQSVTGSMQLMELICLQIKIGNKFNLIEFKGWKILLF